MFTDHRFFFNYPSFKVIVLFNALNINSHIFFFSFYVPLTKIKKKYGDLSDMKKNPYKRRKISLSHEMKTREQYRKKQQTNGNRAIWLVCWMDTNARGFWFVKRTLGWKNLIPKDQSRNQPILRFDVILQRDWPIEQFLLHIRVFFDGKTKSRCFHLFIHWLIKQIRTPAENTFQGNAKIALYVSKKDDVWRKKCGC